MSQLLTPFNGGAIPEVQTTTATARLNVLSPQYIQTKSLQSRPTEWVPDGRPIYKRLPSTAETYQINFFNLVSESSIVGNNRNLEGIEKIGYVYVPYGASINGPISCEVVASDTKKDVLVKSGAIVWEYGKTILPPAIINLKTLDVLSGKYDLAYELIYDDSPEPRLYSVTDFALTGLPLGITSSTDKVIGWRYGALNAFLNSSVRFWSNSDSFFPSYSQPAEAYLEWESELAQAYSTLSLRIPSDSTFTGSASLYYVNGLEESLVQTVNLSQDSEGFLYLFSIESPVLQTGWKVTFSSLDIKIQSVTISGLVTLMEPQATASPRSALVLYPSGTLPTKVKNSLGKMVPATYCMLAVIEVGNNSTLLDIEDARSIIHRDFVPVANWLTKPFDEDLINLYEQVSDYASLWMAPPSCMRQEYENLLSDQIEVEP